MRHVREPDVIAPLIALVLSAVDGVGGWAGFGLFLLYFGLALAPLTGRRIARDLRDRT